MWSNIQFRPPQLVAWSLLELAASPPLNATALPQQKILDDELAFASRKWAATCLAGYLAISFGTDFDSDDAIERVAIWTDKGFSL
jgi:hypothetical protein